MVYTYEVEMIPVPETGREAGMRLSAGMEAVNVGQCLDRVVGDVDC